jgi:hypothetical protein
MGNGVCGKDYALSNDLIVGFHVYVEPFRWKNFGMAMVTFHVFGKYTSNICLFIDDCGWIMNVTAFEFC